MTLDVPSLLSVDGLRQQSHDYSPYDSTHGTTMVARVRMKPANGSKEVSPAGICYFVRDCAGEWATIPSGLSA